MARLAWLSQQPRTSGRPVHAKLNPPQCETNVTSRFHCVPSDVPTRALLTNATQPPRVTPLKRSKLVLVLRSLSTQSFCAGQPVDRLPSGFPRESATAGRGSLALHRSATVTHEGAGQRDRAHPRGCKPTSRSVRTGRIPAQRADLLISLEGCGYGNGNFQPDPIRGEMPPRPSWGCL